MCRGSAERDRDVYAYDAYGNRAREQRTIGAETTLVRRSYTPLGLVDTTTFPDGARSNVTYTAANAIGSLAFAAADAPFETHAEFSAFDASHHATRVRYGNGLGEQRPTNELGQIVSLTFAAPSGTVMWQRNYVWDALRRLTAIGSPPEPESAQSFGYDAVGRLISSTGPYAPQAYGYSPGGNLIQKNDIEFAYCGHRVESGTIDARPCSTGATTPTARCWPRRGTRRRSLRLRRRKSTHTCSWARRDLRRARGADAQDCGRRNRYPLRHIGFRDDANRLDDQHTYYLPGPAGPAVQIGRLVGGPDPGTLAGVPAVGTRYLLKDQIGTTSLVTDGTGAVAASATYLPYGEVVGTPPAGYRFGFTGRELDVTSQLFYFDARYYDAFLGVSSAPMTGSQLISATRMRSTGTPTRSIRRSPWSTPTAISRGRS